ncbi:hypothetical protein AD934_11285 [Gluconobacter oxydans]|uniref:Uncharacterized protein n=1 Tax=Gluconobacter oxydans TaxID=442 RepID=A0A149RTD5_GLUOY|nr:hypothetical protein AD934_11285 [Gluconobacter oxydans]
MFGHEAPCAKAGPGNETGIGDMRATAFLIGLKIECPDDLMVTGLRDIDAMLHIHPVRQRLPPSPVTGQRVGFCLAQDRGQETPDSFTVQRLGGTDQEVRVGLGWRERHNGTLFHILGALADPGYDTASYP